MRARTDDKYKGWELSIHTAQTSFN